MDQYLSLINHYEELAYLDLEYCQEFELVDRIEKSLMVIPRFIDQCLKYIATNHKLKELDKYLDVWNTLSKSMTKEQKNLVVMTRLYPSVQDTYQISKNLNYLFQLKLNGKKERELYFRDAYLKRTIANAIDKEDKLYNVTIEDLISITKRGIEDLQKEKDRIRNYLQHPGLLKDVGDELSITKLVKSIIGSIKRSVIAFLFNLRSLSHAMKDSCLMTISEHDKKFVQEMNGKLISSNSPEVQDLVTRSKFLWDEKIGNTTFHIYQLPVTVLSCFNLDGTNIYVDGVFMSFSKPVQRAILYHEFGHYMAGHFQLLETPDERERIRQIHKDLKQFRHGLDRSPFWNCIGDDELIYLLPELEADRFASKYLGKSLVSRSTRYYANNLIHAQMNPSLSEEDKELVKAYNQERIRIRAELL